MYFFRITPLRVKNNGDLERIPCSSEDLMDGYMDIAMYPSADAAIRNGVRALPAAFNGGVLSEATAAEISASQSGRSPEKTITLYRATMICKECGMYYPGDDDPFEIMYSDTKSETEFVFDRKELRLKSAEICDIDRLVCRHCQATAVPADFVVGIDLVMYKEVGIRYVSLRGGHVMALEPRKEIAYEVAVSRVGTVSGSESVREVPDVREVEAADVDSVCTSGDRDLSKRHYPRKPSWFLGRPREGG